MCFIFADNYDNLKISKQKNCNFFDVTNIQNKYQFITNEFQYLIDEDEIVIDDQIFIIGSISDGGSGEEEEDEKIYNNIEVCLLENTNILTDQGWIDIQDISKFHTINNYKIKLYTKGYYNKNNRKNRKRRI